MKQTSLGGLAVSAQGLGCLGMSGFYGQAGWDEREELGSRGGEVKPSRAAQAGCS